MKHTLYTSLTALFIASSNLYASNINDQDALLSSPSHSKNEMSELDSEGTQITENQCSTREITLVASNEQSEAENNQINITNLPSDVLKLIFLEVSLKDIESLIFLSNSFYQAIESNLFKKIYIDNFASRGRVSPELKEVLKNITFDSDTFSIKAYVNKILSSVYENEALVSLYENKSDRFTDTNEVIRNVYEILNKKLYVNKRVHIDKDVPDTQQLFRKLAIALHAHKLFTKRMDEKNHAYIMGHLSTVPADEIIDRINAIAPYLTDFTNRYKLGLDHAEIIVCLTTMPTDLIRIIAENRKKLFTKYKENMVSVYDRNILKTLKTMLPDQLEDRMTAITTSREILRKDMSVNEQATVINAVLTAPIDQIEERINAIINNKNILFTKDIRGNMYTKLIEALLLTAPANLINAVLPHVQIFFTKNMADCDSIINALVTVPADNITERINAIAENKNALFTAEMSKYEYINTIISLAKLSPEDFAKEIQKSHM